MHDIRAVRADPAGFDAALARRGLPPASSRLTGLDAARRAAQTAHQEAQARRNTLAREIGQARRRGEETTGAEAEAAALRERTEALEREAAEAAAAQDAILETLPNRLDDEVPDGGDETGNVVLHQHRAPPNLPFPPRDHAALGEALGMDFAAAAKLSGARFVVLRGALARLERALGQWMLDLHLAEHGYAETAVPLLVQEAAMRGTGQLPKFAEDLFRTTDGRWLVPTAEVPLTNLVAGEILDPDVLPVRLAALSPCFRSEAGSAGRDTRGMIRQHQFQKVELVSVTAPEESGAELERMTRCAERVLTELGLVWRRVLLCAGDTGFAAARTHDLEVWLPGQGAWREISSCSNTRDFQARRMAARVREREGRGNRLVHTLNGSGVAVGRALVAVLETHQRADGSVEIPEVLRPYMGGLAALAAAGVAPGGGGP